MSRDEYLRAAARYETARLRSLPRSDRNAAALCSQDRFAVDLAAGGPTVEFIRVEPGAYIDGLNEALRDRIIAIPNRSNDLARWRDMLEVHRQNRVTVSYPYYMSETIITNGMFQVFVDETQYTTTVERYKTGWIVDQRAQWRQGVSNSWRLQPWPMSAPEHPVVQVRLVRRDELRRVGERQGGYRLPGTDQGGVDSGSPPGGAGGSGMYLSLGQ